MTLIVWTLVLCVLMYGPVTEACPSGCSCERSIDCNGTHVDCNYKGLTKIPTNIPTDTCSIYLERNQINTILDNAFNGLPNLQILWLYSNKITTIPDNAFNGMPNLKELLLQRNQITTIQDNAFKGLPNLQTLWLQRNQITTIQDNAFKGLPNLQTLDIRNNKITVLDKRLFKDLPKLERLEVEINPLHCDCILAEFVSFAKSKNLTLKYTTEPKCSTPGNLTGVMIKDLSLEIMGCYLTTTTKDITTATKEDVATTSKEDPTTPKTTLLETQAILILVRISLRKSTDERGKISVEEMVRNRLVRLLYSTKEQDIETYQEIGDGQFI